MHVHKIDPQNPRDLDQWVRFPYDLYKHSDLWVPPLISSEATLLDAEKHPFYQHSTADFLVAEENGQTLGRIALIHNRRYNEHCRQNAGFFGFFEVVEDIRIAQALFQALFQWAEQQGFDRIAGPKGLIGADASGVLVEGFEHRPALNIPYNFAYYDTFIQDSGLVKETDYLSGHIDTSGGLPERIQRISDIVQRRRGFWVKEFKDKRELVAFAPKIIEAHRRSFDSRESHYPYTDEEYAWTTKDLLTIADPLLIKIVMKDDETVGFLFAYPDITDGLRKAKGRLFPFGWYHILRDRKRTKWLNVNGLGVVPEYQGLGANAVLYAELAKTMASYRFEHVDTVLIAEENFRSFSDNVSVGVTWYKRHRRYQKELR
ncbi:MAG: hypothetical protein PVI78_06725 [Anaerolineales bacterium]|jgi:hypothetical protein